MAMTRSYTTDDIRRMSLAKKSRSSIYRAAACFLRAQIQDGNTEAVDTVAKKLYGRDHGLDLILRASTTPAT
jgi:hypothetical protein